jgi:serine/threonine-protein kinase
MGEVWAARHRMLARPSAIKLIRPEILGASEESRTTAIKRFEREAKATARLTSPHTVVVYDFGTTVNGSFYYAMELLNGIDLDSLVDRFGPVEPARAVFLLSQACDSLQEAHDVGLIHRDVKPANMLACRIGRQHDFVKVLDFGLVKTLEAADRNTQLTGEIITGTPAYMAPEQATDVSQVDHRTDIYALGCVLYWLVTGHQVFGNNSPMATIADHITSKPVVPSRRAEVEIPPAMDQLILDCLEKRPDDRPQSVAEVQAQLTDLVTDAWTPARADAWWESHIPLATSEDVLASGATPLGVVRVR